MKFVISTFVLLAAANLQGLAEDYIVHVFEKKHVNPYFWSEGAHFGDFNRDGLMDIVSGPYWYEGPDFNQHHAYFPDTQTFKRTVREGAEEETLPGYEGALGTNNAYSENFFAFTHDFNQDGWTDILIVGFPGKETLWYENPKNQEGHWKRHVAFDVTDNESPTLADITGDGKPELICGSRGFYGYAEPDWEHPEKMWTWHAISPKGPWHKYTHGLGIGDVNGDGRMDLLEKGGWWEQPASLEGDPVWENHPFTFGTGGAQMYAYDVDGDGDNDVITSLTAHGYGLAWYENDRVANGEITFREHIFVNKEPNENKYGVHFSQLHALDLVDMDNDGLKDIITGKRFWAHGSQGDPEPNASAVLYWFKLTREEGEVGYIPYLIDNDSGVGTQVLARDIDGDSLPELVVGNKKGTFFFSHSIRKTDRNEWEERQPKVYEP